MRLAPSDWLTAAVAPLDMDMATTMRNRPHWLTMPSAACTSALMRPATQILMKPMKKTRYIMSICGQVSFHMARGETLRSGSGMRCSKDVCVRMTRKRLVDSKGLWLGRLPAPAARRQAVNGSAPAYRGVVRPGRAGDRRRAKTVALMGDQVPWTAGQDRTPSLQGKRRSDRSWPKRSKGEEGAFPLEKSPSPFVKIRQAAQDYSRPS